MRHKTHDTVDQSGQSQMLTRADLVRLCGGDAICKVLERKNGLHVQPPQDGGSKSTKKGKRK